jgi:hypothetical protein
MVDAHASNEALKKSQPLSVMFYNKYRIAVNKSVQLPFYYYFHLNSTI